MKALSCQINSLLILPQKNSLLLPVIDVGHSIHKESLKKVITSLTAVRFL